MALKNVSTNKDDLKSVKYIKYSLPQDYECQGYKIFPVWNLEWDKKIRRLNYELPLQKFQVTTDSLKQVMQNSSS